MSALSQASSDSCLAFCNHDVSEDQPNPARVVPYDSRHNHQTVPERKETDDLLCQAMEKLTLEERKKQHDIVHGADDFVEDPTLVDRALQDLDHHLSSMKRKSMYEVAERIKPDYVHSRAFRVMFLRANEYDATVSADKMLRFFESKYQLFGIEKLVEDITLSDLSEEDVACLKTGYIQLAGRDKSGRQVVLHFGGPNGNLESWLRVQYFIRMRVLEAEENQLRGIVVIWCSVGDLKNEANRSERIEVVRAANCLPQKKQAVHICIDEMWQYVLCNVMINLIKGKTRARLRVHFGSQMEFQYQLSAYGIPPQSIPLDAKGRIDVKRHLQWIQSCTMEDQFYHSLQPKTSVNGADTVTPSRNDVLFTGSKIIYHLGNKRFHAILQNFEQVYDDGNSATKRQISTTVIEKIHESGGRFLQQQQQQQTDVPIVWKEVPVEDLRKKIMQSFRNRRRMATPSRRKVDEATNGTSIAGEPRPNDVIFGRAQRNPGSKLLHRLINDNFEEYESLSRGVKMRLVETVMQTIKDQGGRFLLKSTAKSGEPSDGDKWLEVSHNNARERISQYFRNYRRPGNTKR